MDKRSSTIRTTSVTRSLQGHIPGLDGIRGLAVLVVFCLHYGADVKSANLWLYLPSEISKLGWVGVSLFFVLSGFLITGILWDTLAQPRWWSNFYLRRCLRIFPLYYLALLLAVVLASTATDHWPDLLLWIWPYLLYLQNVPAILVKLHAFAASPLHHFWSLAVEEQFYLVWPFLLFLLRGRRGWAMRLCVSCWLLSLAFRIFVFAGHVSIYWATQSTLGRGGELCVGAWLALRMRGTEEEQQQTLHRLPWLSAGCLSAFGLALLGAHSPSISTAAMATFGLSALSLLSGGIVAGVLLPGRVQWFFQMAWLRWLGKISYGVYIYHVFLRSFFEWAATALVPHADRNTYLLVRLVIAIFGTLGVASLSFYTYESFFLSLKDRFTTSPRRHSPSAAKCVAP